MSGGRIWGGPGRPPHIHGSGAFRVRAAALPGGTLAPSTVRCGMWRAEQQAMSGSCLRSPPELFEGRPHMARGVRAGRPWSRSSPPREPPPRRAAAGGSPSGGRRRRFLIERKMVSLGLELVGAGGGGYGREGPAVGWSKGSESMKGEGGADKLVRIGDLSYPKTAEIRSDPCAIPPQAAGPQMGKYGRNRPCFARQLFRDTAGGEDVTAVTVRGPVLSIDRRDAPLRSRSG